MLIQVRNSICSNNCIHYKFIPQIPEDLKRYVLNLIEDLMDPMVRAIYGTIEGTIIFLRAFWLFFPLLLQKIHHTRF